MDLVELIDNKNIALGLDDDVLDRVGHELLRTIENDDLSRDEWLEQNRDWLRLAAQVKEDKSFPWHGASNVKFPLVTMATVQFHSRAFPNLINNDNPVRAKTIGADLDLQKQKRAHRVEKFMSYQILEEQDEWLDEMDRLLMVLPILGMAYKKTFYSDQLQRSRSQLVLPEDMILNYHATDISRARLTHRYYMDSNEFYEMKASELFRDVDLFAEHKDIEGVRDESTGLANTEEQDEQPFELYESHCFLDLDDDGYKEPYVVTLHADTGKILRITARWAEDGLQFTPTGDVLKIVPEEYITQFIFMPDPNSSVYGIGLGTLIGPLNESVNTIINQLVDAGTLSNLQSGFIGRGVKLRGGSTRFQPGEWKTVNTTGDDLRKGIVPMPVREPSNVLFQLLGLLIDSGQRVASVSDMMVGENPGQNQPASTTMAVLEQGLKVFSSIYKRIHRALGKEYKKLYRLNYFYLDEDHYRNILDGMSNPVPAQPSSPQTMAPPGPQPTMGQEASIEDFENEMLDIVPASDPKIVSDAQQVFKAQSLLEKMAAGLPLNPTMVTRKVLVAEGHDDVDQLMQMPPPQPPFEQVIEMKKFEQQVEMERLDRTIDLMRVKSEATKDMAQAAKFVSDAKANEQLTDIKTYETMLANAKQQYDIMADAFDKELAKRSFEREGQQMQAEKVQTPESGNGETTQSG